jgi:hypothetical protein
MEAVAVGRDRDGERVCPVGRVDVVVVDLAGYRVLRLPAKPSPLTSPTATSLRWLKLFAVERADSISVRLLRSLAQFTFCTAGGIHEPSVIAVFGQ